MQEPKLLFAPFKGLTNKIYRNALARHFDGFDQHFAPFVSGVGTNQINPSKIADVIPIEENLCHTVPQFISTNAREIILLGKTFQSFGYSHVNWNLGCPFARIANKMRGCGILPFTDELKRILDEVFKDFPISLSVKTRLGYRSSDEIFKALDLIGQYPFSSIIIHPRIGTQLYTGCVNLEAFALCLDKSIHQVAYNGDIYHHHQFDKLKKLFPKVNQWMLGRGALIDPSIALEIKGVFLNEEEKRNRLVSFHEEIYNQNSMVAKNHQRLLGYMKAVWFYLSGSFDKPRQVFDAIKTSRSTAEYNVNVNKTFLMPLSTLEQKESYFRTHLSKEQMMQ